MFESLFAANGLSLDRLRCLLEVHEAGSIAKAAPGNPGRQSQYSKQLRQLSEFFGCELTRRTGKILELTPEGLELARIARNQFTELQDFLEDRRQIPSHFSIAAGDSLIQWLVLPQLQGLQKSFPKVRWEMLNLRSKQIIQQVEDGRIHFGLVRGDANKIGLNAHTLGRLRYQAFIPHKLIGNSVKPNSALEALQDLPFAGLLSDGKFMKELQAVFYDAGYFYSPMVECQSFPQLLRAVTSESYCSVLPVIAQNDISDEKFWILGDETFSRMEREICLVWSPRLTDIRPTAAALLEDLRERLAVPEAT